MTTNTNHTDQVAATSTGANADKESIHLTSETTASGAQAAEPSVPALTGRLKVVSDEVHDIRKILQQVIRRLDRILDPFGLSPVDTFEDIEMAESTAKCLQADGITDLGYIEKNVLPKLISGDDAILQLRIKLENYAAYPLIDLLEKPNPDLQLLILMNRLDAQSSKLFLTSFEKHMITADVKADIHIVPVGKKLDQDTMAKNNLPKVIVTTPEMMERMKSEGIINDKVVLAMIVYEAEYVLRSQTNVEIIRKALNDLQNCQVVMACHDGTDDVLRAADAFDFHEEAVIFSMDYINVHSADHFYITENALVEAVLDRAVALSKENTVVVICHDSADVNRMKDKLVDRADVVVLPRASEMEVIRGVVVTAHTTTRIVQSKAHKPVKMIANLSGAVLFPDRYLEMLASYMDVGEQCEVIVKVGSQDALRSLEAIDVSFKQYTAAEH
ncbi:hypothetical protein BGX34_001171 [Mortierella sp. NVP85]|nr:hypothetical protein BGX34_001171 [Mortierella sp. NVP85]